MKAVVYRKFTGPLSIEQLPDPTPIAGAVVIVVGATGLCRSDWHGWMGHDSDITLPHVPGHELAGTIVEVGKGVKKWQKGDRVTVPFVGGCGKCEPCKLGHQQICDHQFQPGFTHWGSFAEYVAIHYADINLVRLSEAMDFVTAASLGCRFITAFRGLVEQGKIKPGQWVSIHGCGGVGLSAIMIAQAMQARAIAVDIKDEKLKLAKSLGAEFTVNAEKVHDVVEAIKDISHGGVHLSMDALGSKVTCFNSISGLRKRGKHIQVGLMAGDDSLPPVPMHQIVAHELEILGSHGMAAHAYPPMMKMIHAGILQPHKLVGKTIGLEAALQVLPNMGKFEDLGITVINQF